MNSLLLLSFLTWVPFFTPVYLQSPATYPIAHPVQLGDSLEGERRREVLLICLWGRGSVLEMGKYREVHLSPCKTSKITR